MQKVFNAWAWTTTVGVVLVGFVAVSLVFLSMHASENAH